MPHLSQGKTALHLAAARGHSRAIRTLLAGGAAPTLPDSEGDLPLHSATLGSQLAAVRLLLDAAPHAAATVNQQGDSPLFLAAWHDKMAIARLLLEAAPQAALIKSHTDGAAPLHVAARKGRQELVRGGRGGGCQKVQLISVSSALVGHPAWRVDLYSEHAAGTPC